MALARNTSPVADGTFSTDGAAAWNANLKVSGAVSGGIPYFDSTTSEATSALLAQYGIVQGGGAAGAPYTTTGFTFGGAAAGTGLAVPAGTATTAVSPLSITQTLNAPLTFPGIVYNITDTSSNAASTMLDLQVAGTSKLNYQQKGGQSGAPLLSVTAGTRFNAIGTSAAYDIAFINNANETHLGFFAGASKYTDIGLQLFSQGSVGVMGWAATSTGAGTNDTSMSRISAGVTGFGTGAAGSFAGSAKMTKLYMDYTNTATVGNVTINKSSGDCILGAGTSSLVITNSLATAAAHCLLTARAQDTTALALSANCAAGNITVNSNAAATGNLTISFQLVNAD